VARSLRRGGNEEEQVRETVARVTEIAAWFPRLRAHSESLAEGDAIADSELDESGVNSSHPEPEGSQPCHPLTPSKDARLAHELTDTELDVSVQLVCRGLVLSATRTPSRRARTRPSGVNAVQLSSAVR
jgi:hypothetical protein